MISRLLISTKAANKDLPMVSIPKHLPSLDKTYTGRSSSDEQVDIIHRCLCRLCRQQVETPEHILLICNASSGLCDLQHNFYVALQTHGLHLLAITLHRETCIKLFCTCTSSCELYRVKKFQKSASNLQSAKSIIWWYHPKS
jgi:hypothetical protein